jgi:voltage-gated potassium channel
MRQRDLETYERVETALDTPMLLLSLIFIPVLLIPVIFDLPSGTGNTFDVVGWAIWAAFVAEFLLLLWLAPSRRAMIRGHLFDLAVIVLPFLRPFRALRALRALASLGAVFTLVSRLLSRHGLGWFLAAVIGIIVSAAGLVTAAESEVDGTNIDNFGDGLWWAVVTCTTVGYGDHFPVSPAGRGIALVLMFVGVGLIGVLTANVAAWFVEAEQDDELATIRSELQEVHRKLDRLLDSP